MDTGYSALPGFESAVWCSERQAALSLFSIVNAGTLRDIGILGQEDTLEEGMVTHPSILAEESCRFRSLAGYSPWT